MRDEEWRIPGMIGGMGGWIRAMPQLPPVRKWITRGPGDCRSAPVLCEAMRTVKIGNSFVSFDNWQSLPDLLETSVCSAVQAQLVQK